MDQRAASAYRVGMTTIGTRIFTALRGRLVGKDGFGNTYYEERQLPPGRRAKRWVVYAGVDDASTVPAEWFGWLHHTSDAPLPESVRKSWQKPFVPNLTGTGASARRRARVWKSWSGRP